MASHLASLVVCPRYPVINKRRSDRVVFVAEVRHLGGGAHGAEIPGADDCPGQCREDGGRGEVVPLQKIADGMPAKVRDSYFAVPGIFFRSDAEAPAQHSRSSVDAHKLSHHSRDEVAPFVQIVRRLALPVWAEGRVAFLSVIFQEKEQERSGS